MSMPWICRDCGMKFETLQELDNHAEIFWKPHTVDDVLKADNGPEEQNQVKSDD